MSSSKPVAFIRSWLKVRNTIRGYVYGHPECEDGRFIHTGEIIAADWRNGRVETDDTIYELEEDNVQD